jgi:hypothetical protein
MKRVVAFGVALCLAAALPLPVASQSGQQLLQGTQLKLVLLNGLSSSVAREGDPFAAVVSEPVYFGGQLILPAGARVHGEIGQIERARRFGILRGQAMMFLKFKSIEIDSREIPAAMSIISIHETSQGQSTGRARKDLRTEEGVIVESKRDYKGAFTTVALAGGAGTGVGAIFSHVMRGLTIGLIGGTTWVMIRKGKEVELPAQTGFLVRLDSTITLPSVSSSATPYTGGHP